MRRRSYLAAIATLMGTSGCAGQSKPTMTQEEARAKFSDVTEFEPPMDRMEAAARFVDEEAGMVFWGFRSQVSGVGAGSQLEVQSEALENTDL